MTVHNDPSTLTIIQHKNCDAHQALLTRFWRVRPAGWTVAAREIANRSPTKPVIHQMPHEERSRMIASIRQLGKTA